jgi:glycosyltransferase involved in cell wall biosynthesis
MGEKAREVDLFIATSRYYSEKSQKELDIPPERIEVINGGINLQGYERSELPFDPPVIGYLCRMSEYFGLGIVVDAFLKLKQDTRFKDLRLHMAGGYTGLDKPFVDKQIARITEQGWKDDIQIFREFDKKNRIPFLKSLTLLSVPVPSGEAFGAYQVEALAAGVPVVQPDVGCYPEFVEATQGGIIFRPNTGEALAEAAASLLQEPERVRRMGERGRSAVMADYSMTGMAKNILKIYERILNHGG